MDRRKVDRRRGAEPEIDIPDIGDVLRILYRRKALLFLLIIAPTLLGYTYIKSLPNIYRAKAQIILEHRDLKIAEFDDVLGGVQFDNLSVPTQIQVIKSQDRVRHTIKELGLALSPNGRIQLYGETEDKIGEEGFVQKAFLESLNAQQLGKSRVIEISFDSSIAEHAATIADKHADLYISFKRDEKRKQAEEVNVWIQKQIKDLKEKNTKKSQEVQEYRSTSGMIQGVNAQDLIFQQISDIARQLGPIETELLDLDARVKLLRSSNDVSTLEITNSALIQNMKSRASQAAQTIHSLSSSLGPNHPSVIAAKNELRQIGKDIELEKENIIKAIETEFRARSQQKNRLEAKLKELEEKSHEIQAHQVKLKALEREELAGQTLLDNFLSRSEEIKSQIDFNRPDVRKVSSPETPSEPYGSKKKLLLLVLIMASTLAAFAIILLLELLDQGMKDLEDVKKILNIKLLGTLPIGKKQISSILNKERTLYTEEIKRVYIHMRAIENAKTFLFTASKAKEGKSATLISLAYYLNTLGKKTLLIDANTVSPNISKMAGTDSSPGLYDLLAGTNKIKEVIIKNEVGVEIMPAGDHVNFTSDLIISGKFEKPLNDLKKSYDYILIDSAPALDTSDSQFLARLTDETIIVAAWAKTPRKLLKATTEYMREMSKNTPHIIINKMPAQMLKRK